jgi:hypothetical protein
VADAEPHADPDGESHFEDLDIDFEEADFVPPAPPVLMSPAQAASTYALTRGGAVRRGMRRTLENMKAQFEVRPT